MKNFKANSRSLLLFGLMASLICSGLDIHPLLAILAAGALYVVSAAFSPNVSNNIVANGISKERWQDYMQKRFFKDNQFFQFFDDHDEYVTQDGNAVHIPNMGSKPTVHVNPTVFPLTVERRTDAVVDYSLDWYITAPTQVTRAEEAEVSYRKMDSVMGDHVSVENERAADEMLVKAMNLLPGTNVLRTTGGPNAEKTSNLLTGQVGDRLILHPRDLKRAQYMLNNADIPKTDRYAILDSNSLDQLTDQMTDNQSNAFNQFFDEKTGALGKLYGFTIFERSKVAVAADALNGSSELVVDPVGAAVDATDQLANLLWYKRNIGRAMGTIEVMHNPGQAVYGGDIMNANFRFGGSRKYLNGTGVLALVQATAP